jgi:acid-sensing ion channel, other
VYRECGCVPFFLIRNESMDLCDIRRMACFHPYEKVMFEQFNYLYASDGVCKCLPACNSIEYNIDFFEEKHDFSYDKWESDYVMIKFRYRNSEHFPLIRSQVFKTKDFISCIGGLLGLFAGISVLSIIEFLYFFSLRICTNIFMKLRNSD